MQGGGVLNPRDFGSQRDKAILAEIEARQALNTDQVQALFFRDMKGGDRKARERLLKLYERKRVKRCQVALTEPYCYYTGNRHGRLEHLLDLNWVYVWLRLGLKTWEELHCFEYEQDFGILQSDALAVIKNTVTGRLRVWLVEMDRGTDGFDKVERYNRLYSTEGYTDTWWAPLVDRFPLVQIVTTSAKRAAKIRGYHIRRENKNGLEFGVRLLEDLRRDCLGGGNKGGRVKSGDGAISAKDGGRTVEDGKGKSTIAAAVPGN